MRGCSRSVRPRRSIHAQFALTLATVCLLVPLSASGQQRVNLESSPFLRIDPERILISDRDSRVPCGECHVSEYEVWQQTSHATGFETMHRKESARDILQKMQLTVTKRQESLCMRCHYTVGPELRAIAGVSCESCHGPARDWINVHNAWGDGVDHPDREDAQHRQQRIAQSTERGMLRPSGDLYAVAANCFECHTVPIEKLVDTGGHSTGSTSFDLVERVEEIRHSFVQEQWGGTPGNRAPEPERRRLTFVTGRILAYEFALRGMANATSQGRYAKAMERRVQQAARELDAVAAVIPVPAIRDILKTGGTLRLVPGNRAAILAAATRIRTLGRDFANTVEPERLATLDPLLGLAPQAPAGAEQGTGGGAQPAAASSDTASAGGAATGGAATAGAPATSGAAGTDLAATQPAAEAPPVPTLPGRVRNRPDWQPGPDSRYKTTLANCGKCHDDAEAWWYEDKHQATAERLNSRLPEAVSIATLYGISPADMVRGDRMCMSCHGTAPSAAPGAPVLTGVSCERCHGPSSEYLDPHENGGNPQLGMTALKQANVQAGTCLGCHRITDDRLLAAGHPSGADYDVVAATGQIRHWPDRRPERERGRRNETYAGPNDAALRAAGAALVSARPVPQVTVATLPARSPARAGGAAAGGGGRAVRTADRAPPVRPGSVTRRGEAPTPSTPPVRPRVRQPRTTAPQLVELEPIPAMADTLTSEQILLLVKRRLDHLITLLGRSN